MILVIGSSGLLGATLSAHHNVISVPRSQCDITDIVSIRTLFGKYSPEVVINCAGIVPKALSDDVQALRVNALGPKLLRAACNEVGARLIQISTDCVFSGTLGNYGEESVPNPTDIYGMSKYLGEIYDSPHLTIRTSFVGLPDAGGRGLLYWASKQSFLIGYDKVFWNGVTTVELGRRLFNVIIPQQVTGILHLHGETVSKYDVLVLANELFGWKKEIFKESSLANISIRHSGNRTLVSKYPQYQTTKTLKEMLEDLRVPA